MSKGTALVTGASSGIGAALAREFAEQGFDLIITARRQERLTALQEELCENVQVEIIVADLTTSKGLTHLFDALENKSIDILVNNAGVGHPGQFHNQPIEQIEALLALNITAVTRLVHYCLPKMIKAGAGRILNVASVAAFQPVPFMAAYAASKAFVLSFTESLAEETRGTGVSVTALCPGMTKTENHLADLDIPPFLISSAETVASQGYEALMQREVICIPGATNKAAVTWAQHQPRWLVRGLGGLLARFNGTTQR
jgi:short-subunit dehydrogenase